MAITKCVAYSLDLNGEWITKEIGNIVVAIPDHTQSTTISWWIKDSNNVPIVYVQAAEWSNDDTGASGIINAVCYLDTVIYYLPNLPQYKTWNGYIKAIENQNRNLITVNNIKSIDMSHKYIMRIKNIKGV